MKRRADSRVEGTTSPDRNSIVEFLKGLELQELDLGRERDTGRAEPLSRPSPTD